MDPISILGLVSIGLILVISVMTLRANRSSLVNRTYFFFSSSVALWALTVFFENSTQAQGMARILTRIDFSIAALIMPGWVMFGWSLSNVGKKPKRSLVFSLLAIALFFVAASLGGFVVKNIRVEEAVAFDMGVLFPAYAAYVLTWSLAGMVLVTLKFRRSEGTERTKALLVLCGLFLSFTVVLGTNVIYPQFAPASLPVSRIGLASLFFMTALPAYAIIRYRFLDVTVVIKRTLSYLLILAMAAVLYSLSIFFLTKTMRNYMELSDSTVQIVSLLLIALSIFPLKTLVDKYLNRYLFRGTYDPARFLEEAEGILAHKQQLEEGLSGLSRRLCEAMGVSSAFFLIFAENDPEQFLLNVGWQLGDIPGVYNVASLDASDMDNLIRNAENLVIRDELVQMLGQNRAAGLVQARRLEQEMAEHNISLSMPVLFRDRVSGLLLLGNKVNRRDFSTQDVTFLQTMVQRVAYVVDNERLYTELKYRYEELDTAYEQLKDVDRFKSDIIAIANHELRKPLTLIKGYLDLLNARMEAFDDAKRRELLAMAKKGADQLADILSDIRVVTDIELGKMPLKARELDLPLLARETENLVRSEVPSQFVYSFPEDLPTVYGDHEKLQIVLGNLMENACKFAGEHGEIQVGAYAQEDGVVIYVKDQGPGLPKEYLESVFGMFSMTEDADHHSREGMGLGLYIARKLVELHEGSIWGESEIGSGCSFFFSLPAKGRSNGRDSREWQTSEKNSPEPRLETRGLVNKLSFTS
ncbi:MAG: sensor histidine kinase [Candidatus Geothermincolia bacterium]